MQIKVIFDKETLDKNLLTGWGVSFLIDNRILFDTGERGSWLINNMQHLGIGIDELEGVVISHDHWDHTGGLQEILKGKKLKVFGCPNFSRDFKKRVEDSGSDFISVDKLTKISDDLYLTGEISGFYAGTSIAEQAVIIKTPSGISVLTGCSHPGIVKILKVIKNEFPEEKFYLVAGGFHLIEQDERLIRLIAEEFKKMGVSKVGPTHCTGREAEEIFKDKYKDDFISINVGQTLEL